MTANEFCAELIGFFGIGLTKQFQEFLASKINGWNNAKKTWVIERIKLTKSSSWRPVVNDILSIGEDYEDFREKVEQDRKRDGELTKRETKTDIKPIGNEQIFNPTKSDYNELRKIIEESGKIEKIQNKG